MKTTKTAAKKPHGTCSCCGLSVVLRPGWFGEQIVEFHGFASGGSRRGVGHGASCKGSRLPPAEVGAERIAAYIKANDERVASYTAK